MTGYGRSQVSSSERKITVEIKSLNSKQFDLSARIPAIFREKEIELRNMIAGNLERGKTDLIISLDNRETENITTVNTAILARYKEEITSASHSLGIPLPQDWYSILLRMPDAMHSEPLAAGESDFKSLFDAVDEACALLKDFRIQEGKKLYIFFKQKIANIKSLLAEIEPFEKERVIKIRSKLEEQLTKLSGVEYDAGRLEQELIFYIEKLDVNEEKLRLASHMNYFLETLGNETDLPAEGQGKKLGFIAQEMGREINTLGSKSNNADMQKTVVKMKDELEQIKEQVLNVL